MEELKQTEDAGAVEQDELKMCPQLRYYYLHRAEKNAKNLERYHNRPDVIAKKEARERVRELKQAEKEAALQRKIAEREAKRIERIQTAMATRHAKKEKASG